METKQYLLKLERGHRQRNQSYKHFSVMLQNVQKEIRNNLSKIPLENV